MSINDTDQEPKQFQQSTPATVEPDRNRMKRLDQQYKPVGISAVAAAAHYTEKARKKPNQMG